MFYTFCVIVIYHLCYNFKTILIILYIYERLICKNLLPLVIDNFHSTLYMPLTSVAP